MCNITLHLFFSFIDNKKLFVFYIQYILNRVSFPCQLFQGKLSVGSEGNHSKQRAGEDVIERGVILQPQKTAELGCLGHMVLALDEG